MRPVQPSDSRCLMLLCAGVSACAGCGCDFLGDVQTPSSPLKSGSLVEPPQEADAGQRMHSLGRPEAANCRLALLGPGGGGVRT